MQEDVLAPAWVNLGELPPTLRADIQSDGKRADGRASGSKEMDECLRTHPYAQSSCIIRLKCHRRAS